MAFVGAALKQGLVHCSQGCFLFGVLLSEINNLALPSARHCKSINLTSLIVLLYFLFVFHLHINSSAMLQDSKCSCSRPLF